MKRLFSVILVGLVCSLQILLLDSSAARGEALPLPLLKAAVFVQNRAGTPFQEHLDELNDLITSQLTEKGFSVIDKNVVVAKFRESRAESDITQRDVKILDDVIKTGEAETSMENAISGASALRIAQMVGADYLIMAAINSFSTEVRTFRGQGTLYATDNQSNIFNLRMTLKVLEGAQGGSVYADSVTASERIVVGQGLTIETNDIVPKLLETCAQRLAEKINGKVGQIRNMKTSTIPTVEFQLISNVEGVTVEMDGAVIGTTPGRFNAAPGLHQIRLSKEWLSTWERTINILPNQHLNVPMELSKEGMQRYETLEKLKIDLAQAKQNIELEKKEREAAIEITKEQSAAKAYAEKKIAEGEKEKRSQSYERMESATSSATMMNSQGGLNP